MRPGTQAPGSVRCREIPLHADHQKQSDMPQFTQVLLDYAADRRDRIAMTYLNSHRAGLQRAGRQFAMTMDEAKFFDIPPARLPET